MERVEFKNSRGLTLVGDWYKADNQKIIIMCHGFTGDRIEHGRFERAAEKFHKAGFNVLKFDFSGSGESDDDPLTVDGWDDDLGAATNYVKQQGMTKVGIMGHSLGGLIALKHHSDAIALVIWAPVTNRVANARDRYPDKLLSELDEKGYMTYKTKGKLRDTAIVPKQMLDDRESVDQKSLLHGISEPVLIIHGERDEAVPISDSENAVKILGSNSELVIVPEATHALTPYLDSFIKPTTNWFKNNL